MLFINVLERRPAERSIMPTVVQNAPAASAPNPRFGRIGLNPGFRYRYTRGYILESLRDSLLRLFSLTEKIPRL